MVRRHAFGGFDIDRNEDKYPYQNIRETENRTRENGGGVTERIVPDGYGAPGRLATAEAGDSVAAVLPAVSRRGVLSGAVAASALVLPSAPSAWAAIAPRRGGPLRAVFDRAVPQGLAFAERARLQGVASFGFTEDMSRLWLDRLLPALREDRGPMMGLTGAGALFCFEQLAWDVGMRVRLRVDHVRGPGGFEHFAGTNLPSAVLSRLRAANAAFGESAADMALDCRPAWGDCTHAAAADAEALVTWVIAPLDLS